MIRVGIDPVALAEPRLWHDREPIPGIGGAVEYYICSAVYVFHLDDGHMQRYDGEIRVAQPAAANSGLPSSLGWDVLRYFRIDLDIVDQQVTLRWA
jgi:hypothetical protein